MSGRRSKRIAQREPAVDEKAGKLSKKLAQLVQQVAARGGSSVDLTTKIDDQEVTLLARKEGSKFHLTVEVPEERQGKVSNGVNAARKAKSSESAEKQDSVVQRRSSRHKGRVTWRKSGGMLQKVVVEPKETNVESKKTEDEEKMEEEEDVMETATEAPTGEVEAIEEEREGELRSESKEIEAESEEAEYEEAECKETEIGEAEVEEAEDEEAVVEEAEAASGESESSMVGTEVKEVEAESGKVEAESNEERLPGMKWKAPITDIQPPLKERKKDEDQVTKTCGELERYQESVVIAEPEADAGSSPEKDSAVMEDALENKTEAVVEETPHREESGPDVNQGKTLEIVSVQSLKVLPLPDPHPTAEALIVVGGATQDRATKRRTRFKRPKEECNMCHAKIVTENLEWHQTYQCKANPVRAQLLKCDLCLFTSADAAVMRKHRLIHPPGFKPKQGKNCICEVCGLELASAKSKVHHEWKVHDYFGNRVQYQCDLCEKRFPSKWQHDEHMGYHLDRRNFVCDLCGKKFRSKQEVKEHQKYGHVVDHFPFQCAHCRVGMRTEEEVQSHECKMVAELIQSKGFRGVNQVVYLEILDDEVDEVSPRKAPGDGDSGVIIVDKVKDTTGEEKNEDEEEPDEESVKMLLSGCGGINVHQKQIKQEEGAPMSRQPCIFFDLQSIAEHHSGPIKVSERYMCEYCGDLFTNKSLKYAHRRTEHGYRKLPKEMRRKVTHSCEICGKKFVYKDSLRKHYLHTHSDERKHVCEICGKTFKRATDKDYHINTMHKNQFKYHCKHCGHGVHRKHYLANHQCNRVHRRSTVISEPKVTTPVASAPEIVFSPATIKAEAEHESIEVEEIQVVEQHPGAAPIDTQVLGDILAQTTSGEAGGDNQKWIIQQSSDGQQILVIQAGLEDAVQDGVEILVDGSAPHEVAQMCEAAAILTNDMPQPMPPPAP